MDITISRSLFSRRRNAGPPRRAKAEEVLSNVNLETYNLVRIKNEPGHNVFNERIRPIHRACRSCIVNSQTVVQSNYMALGSHSCFLSQSMDQGNPFYVRMMPDFWHYIGLPNLFHGMEAITPEELENVANSLLHDQSYNIPPHNNPSNRVLDPQIAQRFTEMFGPRQMSVKLKNFVTKVVNWIFGKMLSFSFNAICVHFGDLELVRAAVDTGLPVVFIPLHRSHLDPFLISWTLFNRGIHPPLFIAPHSLIQTPVLGWMAKLFGGLGCKDRRKASAVGYLDGDVNVSLLSYIHLGWSKGNSVMIPIETHRSRSGKPSTYHVGREFFSVLQKLYDTREIEDAIVIPVSVNYDVLPEEDLISKQVDPSANAEPKSTFWRWLLRLTRNLGFARVSFSQPFRLREFQFAKSKAELPESYLSADPNHLPVTAKAAMTLPGTEFNWIEEYGSVASLSSIYGETDCMEPTPADSDGIDALIDHGFFDAYKSTVFMCTHLVSFLLLKKFRDGVDMDRFVLEFDILEVEIRTIHKHDLGFTADLTLDVVERSVALLGAECIQKYKKDGKVWLKPCSKKCGLLKLNYYANHIVALFARRGITATALFNVVQPSVWMYADLTFTRSNAISVEESDVICKGIQIGELLKSEFLLHRPCKNLTDVITETLWEMKDFGELQFDGAKKAYPHTQDEWFDHYDDLSETGDDPIIVTPHSIRLTVNNTSEALNKLKFQRSLILPYLHLYGVATEVLTVLIPAISGPGGDTFFGVEDMSLRKHIFDGLESSFKKGFLRNEELITTDVIRNFLHSMENMGVIRFYAGEDTGWLKMYYLAPEYETTKALKALTTTIFSLSLH